MTGMSGAVTARPTAAPSTSIARLAIRTLRSMARPYHGAVACWYPGRSMAAPIRLTVPGTLRYRAIAVRVVAEAARLVSGSSVARSERSAGATTCAIRSTRPSCRRSWRSSTTSRSTPTSARGGGMIELAITPTERELVDRDQGSRARRSTSTASRRCPTSSTSILPEGGMGIHIAKTMLDEDDVRARAAEPVAAAASDCRTCSTGGADVQPVRRQRTTAPRPSSSSAARSTSTPRRSSPRRSTRSSPASPKKVARRSRPRLDLIDSSGVAALVKLYKGVRGGGGAVDDHRRARSAARDLQAAADGQGVQPVVLCASSRSPRSFRTPPSRCRRRSTASSSPRCASAATSR